MTRGDDAVVLVAVDLAGPEIQFDHAALLGRRRQQVNVNLVGAEAGAALADLGKVQGAGGVDGVADRQNRAAAGGIAVH